jgi:serine/threonine protein kinase
MPIQSGTRLGPYEIISAIGAGGMGEVYRARDPKLGRVKPRFSPLSIIPTSPRSMVWRIPAACARDAAGGRAYAR